MRRCLVFALLIVATPLAFAQAYKWKDAQGQTHYTDAPPPGKTKYETIKTPASNAAPAAQQPSTPAAAPAATTPVEGRTDTPAHREALCAQLTTNVTALQSKQAVTMDDGKGGVKQVDDATREAELKKAHAQMTLYCPS